MATSLNAHQLPAWAIEPEPEQVKISASGSETSNRGGEEYDSDDDEYYDQEEFEQEWHNGLKIFQMIEIGTCITACLLALIDIYNLIVFHNTMSIKGGFMRLFGISFSFLVWCLEFDKFDVSKELSIFENWLAKGIFYVYLGSFALSLDEGEAEVIDSYDFSTFSNFIMFLDTLSAICMGMFGLIYILMGLTCRKQVKELMQIEHHLIHGHQP